MVRVDQRTSSPRRGTVAPILAFVMVVLVSFLALAIDVGMLAIAKTQAQQSADLAALISTRTLNGVVTGNYNLSAATTNAQNVLTYNAVLGQKLVASQLALTFGSYDYDQTAQTFTANFPATTGHPYTATAATVTTKSLPVAFSSIFGTQMLPNVQATAQAVHRPRDIALALDFSGSMRLGTELGFDYWTPTRGTNNPDPVYPKFGHYSSSSAVMQGPSTNRVSSNGYTLSPSNTTAPSATYGLTYVNSFYQNAAFASPLIRAFDSYTSTDGGSTWSPSSGTPQLPPSTYMTTPGGDLPATVGEAGGAYAKTVQDIVSSTTRNQYWEMDGYSNFLNGSINFNLSTYSNYVSAPFKGATQGPGYYGKTFFIWPPDPRHHLSNPTGLSTSISGLFTQFFTDFGYTNYDFTTTTYAQALYGIYSVNSSTPGDSNWPWPNDGGASLSTYLTTRVSIPGGSRKLLVSDTQYKQIMRLYNWDYVVDSVGTTSCDWRLRFFGTNNNLLLFNAATGSLNLPTAATYTINYNEILRWINQPPVCFPTQLRAGRIKYYGAIPTAITGTWPNYGNTDQRFWVEFIDYVLGFRQTALGVYLDISSMAGYGSDFSWGTVSLTAPPTLYGTQYMSYTDSPARPMLRHWFGPLNMVDYMQNDNFQHQGVANYYFMEPGDSYEAPAYVSKQGFAAAINSMQTNHPNDWVAIVPYSMPRGSALDNWIGRFNCVRCPLGTNYGYAAASLLYPFATLNTDGTSNGTEVTPYGSDPATGLIPSADFMDAPRAFGNTSFAMGLMLSYNQFAVTAPTDATLRNYVSSSPIAFPSGMAGGMGRKGAQKVVIFETDGMPNTAAYANLINNGTYSYYQVRYDMNKPYSSEYPGIWSVGTNDPTVVAQVNTLVQQFATALGTSRNPFRLYAIGFGPVFQGSSATAAQTTLQGMQYYAGTQTSASTPLPSNQILTGTDTQIAAAMISTYTTILQSGVQIALIK